MSGPVPSSSSLRDEGQVKVKPPVALHTLPSPLFLIPKIFVLPPEVRLLFLRKTYGYSRFTLICLFQPLSLPST